MAKTQKINIDIESHVADALDALETKKHWAFEVVGLIAERHAKEYCPVDTGRLRNSITHDVRENEDCVVIGTNVEYAAYVELGSSRRKNPKPYLRPGIENHLDEYRKAFNDAFGG